MILHCCDKQSHKVDIHKMYAIVQLFSSYDYSSVYKCENVLYLRCIYNDYTERYYDNLYWHH